MANKMAISDFDLMTLGKYERGRGPRCPQIFWSLKNGTRTFNFRYNEPSRKILGPLSRYDHPWEKKQQKN